jgi:hypothetical protein
MVAFSKIKRRGVLLPALCLAVLSLSSLSNAQYFADMNTGDKNAQNLDDEEDSSFVSKLNSHSTWYDVVSAHQRDMFNANGAFKQLSEQAGQVFELLTRDPKRDINNNKAHRERGGLRSGNDEQEAIRVALQKRRGFSCTAERHMMCVQGPPRLEVVQCYAHRPRYDVELDVDIPA